MPREFKLFSIFKQANYIRNYYASSQSNKLKMWFEPKSTFFPGVLCILHFFSKYEESQNISTI